MKTVARWSLLLQLVLLTAGCVFVTANFISDSLSAFVDVGSIAKDLRNILDLSDKMLQGNDSSESSPFDDRFPLSSPELGLLFQIYDKCATNESLALLTWCTGTAANGTSVDGVELCPRGVRTHPCTGRVMDAASDVVDYLWPWQGIKCDAFTDPTTITNIYLPGEGLKCRLQDFDFSHMVSLEQLDLSKNELHGPFPSWLGNMTVLRFLNLRENSLRGKMPLSFGDNIAIEVIDLGRNILTAASLSFFKIFKRLRYLDLSENLFNLTLPYGFFSGDYIEHVNLSFNAFHGTLPPLPQLKHLTALDLSHNSFEGELPAEMSTWGWADPNDPEDDPVLQVLDFSYNRFNGSIPPITKLTALHHFAVQSNQFDGLFPAVPPSLIKPGTPQYFMDNSFYCPVPQLTPISNEYGELTCKCRNGLGRQDSNSSSPVVPAAMAPAECRACSHGTYSNASTHGKCEACPLGFIANVSRLEGDSNGATSCIACGPGMFSNVTSATECIKCPLGSASNDTGQATCKICYPGEYMDREGGFECKMCREGTDAPQEGSARCQPCRRGTFAAHKGEIACLPCPRGQFQGDEGQTLCHDCPVGHVAPHPGHTECKPCRAGSFYESTGRKCVKCAPNTFTDADAQLQCTPCELGRAAEGFGNAQCEPTTRAGFGREGNGEEKECLPGQFNNGSYVTCQPCPLGTFASTAQATQCAECAPGSFSGTLGATQCSLAQPGDFVGDAGADRSLRCPPQHYTDTAGSAECLPCPADSTSLVGGLAQCVPLLDGEIFQSVRWPLIQLRMTGIDVSTLLTNATLLEELRTMCKDVLAFNGVSDFEVHVVDVRAAGPSTTEVKLAIEQFPPPRTQPRAPRRDMFTKISDTYDDAKDTVEDVDNAVDDAKESATQWMDGVSGKSHTPKFRRGRHANVSEVVPQESFRLALSRQLLHTPSPQLRVAASLLDVRLLSEPFESTKAMPCPKGFYFTKHSASGLRRCVACSPGSHADVEGLLDACYPCPSNTFSDIEGLEKCWDCPWSEGSRKGATKCVECDYFSHDCDDFWSNVMTTAVGLAAAGYKIWRRSRELWGGRSGGQLRGEDVALVAAVRTFGRVPWTTRRGQRPVEARAVDAGTEV